jgi:hypothetical protein
VTDQPSDRDDDDDEHSRPCSTVISDHPQRAIEMAEVAVQS